MAGLGTFLLEVGVDLPALQRGLSRAESTIESFGRKAESIGTKLSIAVSAPLALIAKNALSASGEFESLSMSFGVMLKSMDKGKTLMQDLQKYNLKTSFEFPEIASAAKSMLAFGFAQQQVIPNLKMIGDLSSALGINIKDLSDIYGKAKVQGTLFAEDINQLTGRGIPVIAEFAKQFGVSESAIKKMASEGKISFANLEQAFVSMTSKGGQFYNMTASQSTTLKGILSNFADSTTQSLTTLGDSIVKNLDLKNTIGQASEVISKITKSFSELSPEAQKAILVIGGIAIVVPPLLALAGTVLPAIAAGFTALTGPVGIAALAIGAAATYAISHWEELNTSIDKTSDSLKRNFLTLRFYLAKFKGAISPDGNAKEIADILGESVKYKNQGKGGSNMSSDALGNYYANKDGDNVANVLGGGKGNGGMIQSALDAAKKLAEETKKVREDLINSTYQSEINAILETFAKQKAEAQKNYNDDVKAKQEAVKGKKDLEDEYAAYVTARYKELQVQLRKIDQEEFKTPALIKRTLVTDTQNSLGSQLKSSGKVEASKISLDQRFAGELKGIDFKSQASSLESYLGLVQGTINNINFAGYATAAQGILDANQSLKDSFGQIALSASTVVGEMIVNMASGTATIADLAKSMLTTVGNIFADVLQQLAAAQIKLAIVQGISGNPLALIKGIGLGIASGAVGALSKKASQGRASNYQTSQPTQGGSSYVRGGDIFISQNRYTAIKGF